MKLSFSLCCLFSALLLYPLGSQGQVAITPGMVKQAQAMGASNAQINAAINATGGGGGNASAAPAASATATSATPSNTQVGRSAEGQAESSPSNSETSDPTRNTEAESREGENPENLLDKERATSPISRNIFGREIFSTKNLTFAPSYNMPTPPSYVLGPGDEVIIEVWGESETRIQQKISPEGSLSIQGIGPVSLNGLTVSEAQQRISAKMSQIMNGQVKVSLGEIRSIKINISGEVRTPGTYTLPSLATLFNAIYSAGGVNGIGSLRHIQVYRNSKLIADLDVYDYLIYGKYETNIRLEDNDMIIVPPYENHVQITGKVKRERTFELKKGEKLQTLLDYAGGFAGDAYADNLTVYRQNGPTLSIQNVEQSQLGTFVMADGDQVRVGAVLPVYLNMVTIGGAVWRPGEYELSDQVRTLSQLIAKAEGLMGSQFASRGQISRLDSTNTYTVIPFDVTKVVEGTYDIPLANQDQVYIPNVYDLQESYTVSVKGEVNHPKTFIYRKGMTIEDVILIGGGLKESASQANVEIARRVKDPAATTYSPKIAETFILPITADLQIAPENQRFLIEPFDEIYIRRSPGYSAQQSVAVSGEVLFGGEYVMKTTGERISDLIQRTGGLTPEAYVRGASLQRRLTADERVRLRTAIEVAMTNRGKDSLSLASVTIPEYQSVGVDIAKALAEPGCNDDLILQEGDRILIPKYNSTVRISGAVLYQNTVTYTTPKLKDYIYQGGGFKQEARRRPLVVYMNGKVAATRIKCLFFKSYPKIEPGCQIIVPMRKERTGNGLATTMGMVTSTASLAAMLAAILK